MRWSLFRTPVGIALPVLLLLAVSLNTSAQSAASIEGQVVDQNGAVIAGVTITATNRAIGVERVTTSDATGRYQLAALPVGDYSVAALATGFKKQVVEGLNLEVARRVTQDFQLEIGEIAEQVSVSPGYARIDQSTVSLGHVIDRRTVQEIPLNGRYFLGSKTMKRS